MRDAVSKARRLQTALYLAWAVNAIVNCLAPHSLARLAEPTRDWITRHAVINAPAGATMPTLWLTAALLAGLMAQVAFWQRLPGPSWRRFAVLTALGALLSLAHLPWVLAGTSLDATRAATSPMMIATWVGELVAVALVGAVVGLPIAKRLPPV